MTPSTKLLFALSVLAGAALWGGFALFGTEPWDTAFGWSALAVLGLVFGFVGPGHPVRWPLGMLLGAAAFGVAQLLHGLFFYGGGGASLFFPLGLLFLVPFTIPAFVGSFVGSGLARLEARRATPAPAAAPRPRQVTIAVALIAAAIAVGIARDIPALAGQPLAVQLYLLLGHGFAALLCVFIARGHEWARILFLVVTVAVLGFLLLDFALALPGWSLAALARILQAGLQLGALALLLSTPAARWFRRAAMG